MKLLVFICFFPFILMAQETNNVADTLQHPYQDTSIVVDNTAQVHSPKKAALLSLLPGAGQIYNHLAMPKGKKKAFWKVPIIYAGLGVTGYYAIVNHIEQKALKNEYIYRSENGQPNLTKYANYDQQGILTLFENKRTMRDVMIFAFIGVYGLNILDAFVEAHFVHFDISKDLSLNISPRLYNLQTPGISLRFNFH